MYLLVVDDDPSYLVALRTLLTLEGHTVDVAVDGEDALAKILLSPFDMIVSDVYMPRLDGIRLRNTVRALPDKAHLPFLFFSGYDDTLTLEAVMDPIKEGFFKKGRSSVELLAWIKYLTTPPDKRPLHPPNVHCTPAPPNRDRGRYAR